jgi:DNA-binding MarR family transcriptional regulator
MAAKDSLTDEDYVALAGFRHALRQFAAFSEQRAAEYALTPQQHQALLAIRGATGPVSVGYLADQLILKPHSATGLAGRLEVLGLIARKPSSRDRRQSLLELTPKAMALLSQLSSAHRDEIKRIRPLLNTLLKRIGR